MAEKILLPSAHGNNVYLLFLIFFFFAGPTLSFRDRMAVAGMRLLDQCGLPFFMKRLVRGCVVPWGVLSGHPIKRCRLQATLCEEDVTVATGKKMRVVLVCGKALGGKGCPRSLLASALLP